LPCVHSDTLGSHGASETPKNFPSNPARHPAARGSHARRSPAQKPARADLLAPLAAELPSSGPSIARTRARPSGGRTAAHVTDGCLRRATALRGAGDPSRLRTVGGWRVAGVPSDQTAPEASTPPAGPPGQAATRSPTASLATRRTARSGRARRPIGGNPHSGRRTRKRATTAVAGHHGAAHGQSDSGNGNCPSGNRSARRGRRREAATVSSRDESGAVSACDECGAAASAAAIRLSCCRSSCARCRHDCRQYTRNRPMLGWFCIRPPHHSHIRAGGVCSSSMRESSPEGGAVFDLSHVSSLVGQWMRTCRSMTG
jgi:hypothetical protein